MIRLAKQIKKRLKLSSELKDNDFESFQKIFHVNVAFAKNLAFWRERGEKIERLQMRARVIPRISRFRFPEQLVLNPIPGPLPNLEARIAEGYRTIIINQETPFPVVVGFLA